MSILLELFYTFAKIGLFTFGGGYAMISIIENHCVVKKQWITYDEMMNMTIIAESTPGPIAVNLATYVGYKKAGFIGSLIATLGMILPSFIVIYVISLYFNDFLEIPMILNAFKGIKIAVTILIIEAGLRMYKKMKKNQFNLITFISSFIIMFLIQFLAINFSSLSLMMTVAFIHLIVSIVNKGGEYHELS